MSIVTPANQRLKLRRARKTEVRTQFAVLAFRREQTEKKEKIRVCLITSRGTGRWIVPKGWPMRGMSPADAVATEAWEEAGVKGEVLPQTLGLYSYDKRMARNSLPVIAVVYAMEVSKVHKTWPEAGQRKRKWVSPKKAAEKLSDRELARIVANFDPDLLTA